MPGHGLALSSILVTTRVLVVGTFLPASQGTRQVGAELAERLAGAGHPVVVTSARTSRLSRLVDMMATVALRRREYDLAYVEVYSGRSFAYSEAACALLRRLRVPIVIALHGGNLPTFAARWPRRVARLLRCGEVVVAPSPYLAEVARTCGVDVEIIPNAISIGSFRPRPPRGPAGKRLVWLRAFHSIYNPSLAPLVLAEVLETHPGTTLTMIGADKRDGSLASAMAAAEQSGCRHLVEFVGPVEKRDVPGRLAEADIFVNTTNVDNAPVSVIEAMAAGLCIVSTDVGGIPRLLSDGETALLVPPRDAAAMAAAVRRVLDDPLLAERLRRGAVAAAAQYDWAAILPAWSELFSRVPGHR